MPCALCRVPECLALRVWVALGGLRVLGVWGSHATGAAVALLACILPVRSLLGPGPWAGRAPGPR